MNQVKFKYVCLRFTHDRQIEALSVSIESSKISEYHTM